jgi:2-polyprenyl-6-methoxyphenol hydroxylase-like FAD-dependent oxidoreductase
MFDAIIVGARCAGASAAMLLARKGHKVLLLDRDSFPSDMPASTHMVWHAGAAQLKKWDLLDALAATGCPPMTDFHLDLGEFVLSGTAPPASEVAQSYAPRRYVLDGLLVDAAVRSGADLRRGSVSGLLFEDDRVVGIRYSDQSGKSIEERGRLVVGADGTNSTVARSVNAPAYNEHAQLEGNIYAYFADFPLNGMEFYARPGRMIYAWSTNDGMTVAGICIRHDDYRALSGDPEGSFFGELAALAPKLSERARAARRATDWLKAATRNVCRKPTGPGWALVGDAGMTMDPITAAGISNTFRDAEMLADAVHDGLSGASSIDAALLPFEQRRNASSLPLYAFTTEMAKLDPPPQEIIDLFLALRDNPEDTRAYFGVFAQSVPVERFFAPENVTRIVTRGNRPAE